MSASAQSPPGEPKSPIKVNQLLTALRLNVPLVLAFGGSGVMLGSWATTIPAVVDRLHLDWAGLGGTMGFAALGSWLMLQRSPWAIERFGPGVTARSCATVSLAGLAGIEFAGDRGTLLLALLALGMGLAAWDLAMNVAGQAAGDRLLVTKDSVVCRLPEEFQGLPGEEKGRFPLLLPLHGCFSVGAVAGAMIGAALSSAPGSRTWHLVAIAALVVVVEWWAAVYFTAPVLPGTGPDDAAEREPSAAEAAEDPEPGGASTSTDDSWNWRFIGFGVLALWAAVAELLGNDWIALFLVDDYGQKGWRPGVVVVVFLAAMAVGRFVAVLLLNRPSFRILRLGVLLVCLGIVVVAVPASRPGLDAAYVYPLLLLGAAVWGLGASAAMPWAMQEAGKGEHSARQMRTVQVISGLAFLSPAAVGWLSGHLAHAWIFVVVLPLQIGLALLAVVILGLLPRYVRNAVTVARPRRNSAPEAEHLASVLEPVPLRRAPASRELRNGDEKLVPTGPNS